MQYLISKPAEIYILSKLIISFFILDLRESLIFILLYCIDELLRDIPMIEPSCIKVPQVVISLKKLCFQPNDSSIDPQTIVGYQKLKKTDTPSFVIESE
jgi:hypothetical protein